MSLDNGARSHLPGGVIDLPTLAALLDHAHDAIILRRLDGEILYWNHGAEQLYGWSAAEAAGQTSHALLRADLPKPLVAINDALQRDGQWQGRIVHARKNGALVTVESRWALDGAGGGKTVLEINRDITARLDALEAARAREVQLRFITDSAPVLIAHCDREHRFKFVNKPYAARFNLHPSDLIGRSIGEVLGEAAFEAIRPYVTKALAGERVDVEVEVPYESLGPQFMRFAYEPEFDDDGRVVGYVAAVVNVSDRHRAEHALREADQRKDAFLATLAHELRNPLAAMRNAVELLTVSEADSERAGRARTIIDRQLKQLVRLVDDLLDVSRITRGTFQLRVDHVELADVIATAVEAIAGAAAAASQVVRVAVPEQPVMLQADAERLSQAFTNLLLNATKYTPAGGRIEIAAEATGDEVVVRISDTGVGIPADMVERIFDMFAQADSTRDQAFGGLGIGLTLVRVMVELHGGSVRAESGGAGAGSTFVVRLPRFQPDLKPVAPPPAAPPADAIVLRRVLIADDNADAAESLQLWLEMAGHEVHVASDGPRTLEAAEKLHPEVILLDLGMPGLNGFEVARQIRQAPWGHGMKLVALTGWGQDEDRRRTAEAGFDRHLTKPVAPDEIERLVREL